MPGQIHQEPDLWEAATDDNFEATSTKATRPAAPSTPKPSNGKPPTTTIPKPTRPGGGKLPPFAKVYVPTVIGTSKTLTAKTAAENAAKKLKTATAVTWNLKNTSAKAPESFEAVVSTYGPIGESVFATDDRIKVNPKDYAPGGKYRSIVKLFLVYQGSAGPKTLIATGWLISADVVVTAGHCVFDWEHSLNQVTEIKAYIGYEGRASVGSPNVQFRKGIKVATTSEWIKSGESHHDVSFIKLQEPFKGIKPFKFVDTPMSGNEALGVVGYPGDLDRGEYMYECIQKVKFDIVKTRMLQYKIDTFGGNSGAPVIRSKDGASIAVHVMGGKTNQASLIGPMGNTFAPYVQALTTTDKKLAKAPLEISWIEMQIPSSESGDDEAFEADPNGEAADFTTDPESGDSQPEPASEAYQFKKTWDQGRAFTQDFHTRLSAVGLPPSFGLTGRLSALYGHAFLHTMHKRVQRKREAGEEDAEASESIDQGALGRAVLAEAALDTLLSLDPKTLKDYRIFDKLSQHSIKTDGSVESFWNKELAGSGTVGDKLLNVAVSTAAGAILSGIGSLFKKKPKKESGDADDQDGEAHLDGEADEGGEANGDANSDSVGDNEGLPRKPKGSKGPGGKPANGNGATDEMPKVKLDFDGLIQRLLKLSEAEQGNESIVSLLSDSAGTESLVESMPDLVESLVSDEAGDVGGDDQEATETPESNEMSGGLRSRIVLGDAALEAILELGDFTPKGHSESIFTKLWGGVKKVGGFVAKVGPGLLLSAASSAVIGKIIPGKRESGDNDDGNQDGKGDEGGLDPNDEGGDGPDDEGGEGPDVEDVEDVEAEEEAAEESFEEWFKSKSS